MQTDISRTATIPAVAAPLGRRQDSRLLVRLPAREGAFWVLVALAVPKALGAIFTVALRRYLGPGTAGIYDLAYTPYKFLDNFRNFGTGPALVYERTIDGVAANTAWTINMVSAVLVTVAAQLLARPIALYYGHPGIEGILRVLSIAYVFGSISSVHWFLLLRDRNFRARAVPPIGQVVAGGCIAVLVAIWSYGAGALVAREITSTVVGAALLWIIYPFRPSLQLMPRQAWILFRYGSWVGGGITLVFLSQNVDVFIAGRIIHAASDIGFYTTSWSLAFISASVFATVATSIVFPTLSRLQDDRLLLTEKLLRAVRLLSLLVLPASALLASLAPVVIVPVLGNRFAAYESSFLVLSLLAVYAGNRTLLWIFFEGYKSIGRPWLVPAYNAVKLAIMVPAMIYGARHGIVGLAITYIPIQLVEIPAALALARRYLNVSPLNVWHATRAPIGIALLMATVVVLAERLSLNIFHAGSTATLLGCLVLGVLTYLLGLALANRHALVDVRSFLINGL
jgi:PST family polysaccharide transporter